MFTLGLDFGTNSVRALVVRCRDGAELGVGIASYRSGQQGVLLDPRDHHLARQHPGDYLIGIEESVQAALAQAKRDRSFRAEKIVAIGVDTTGSSPLPVDARNRPLALQKKFAKNLHAQCWLWKDHTSWQEARQITSTARQLRPQYLERCGDTYSSEWFWAKLWHCKNVAPEVFAAAHSWVELCDWIPSVLAGVKDPAAIVRGVCAAGHKALFAEDWGGLPDGEFLRALDPQLAELRARLFDRAHDENGCAGQLSAEWAQRLGLSPGIKIGVGMLDVHAGAIGCGVKEGTLVKVIGTSTCDCAVLPSTARIAHVPGISGIVKGSILPGYWGVEAGQSAVGDIFKWWVETVCSGDAHTHEQLSSEAAKLAPGESGLLALDWHNGNRCILGDPMLTGALIGCTLQTTRAEIYRAWIEATAFGARMILNRLRDHGLRIDRIVCAGGIAEKNPLLMQLYADITGCSLSVAASPQACALGSAIVAAVAAGQHPDFVVAQRAMGGRTTRRYQPRRSAQAAYDSLFALYQIMHDSFGAQPPANNPASVMKQLLTVKASTPHRRRKSR